MQVSKRHSTCDVAVIGAGVFGAWIAYQLRRSGKRVILIDAHGPGHSRSSSGGESRIMRMGYGADEIYTRSAQRSLCLWQELFMRSRTLESFCYEHSVKAVLRFQHIQDLESPIFLKYSSDRIFRIFYRVSEFNLVAGFPHLV